MLENTPTRKARKPAVAATKAAPKVAEETTPIGSNGEVLASHADPIQDLVKILAENIRHNTKLLEQIDQRRAVQTGDRLPGIEQLRTILNYKAIGQMTGRRGSAFQDNFIAANRRRGSGNIDELFLFLPLPDDAVKVSVQVDGNQIAPEVIPISVTNTVALIDTRGKDIGRIEVLNSADEPLLLGPRMFAVPLDA